MTEEIDWPTLRATDYMGWRETLWAETARILSEHGDQDLALLNDVGFYYAVFDPVQYRRMERDWEQTREVPDQWIIAGRDGGMWMSLFDPCNASSPINPVAKPVVRFYFKPGYTLFNADNPAHLQLWMGNDWDAQPNPWDRYSKGKPSLAQRLRSDLDITPESIGRTPVPHHKAFYQQLHFGARLKVIDYLYVTLMLNESVEYVEFLGNTYAGSSRGTGLLEEKVPGEERGDQKTVLSNLV